MHRIVCSLPGRQVALRVPAIRGLNLQGVVIVDVAQRALHASVAVGQGKSRGAVVEFSVRPLGDGVATAARRSRARESCSDVVGHGAAQRSGALPRGLVAAQAVP